MGTILVPRSFGRGGFSCVVASFDRLHTASPDGDASRRDITRPRCHHTLSRPRNDDTGGPHQAYQSCTGLAQESLEESTPPWGTQDGLASTTARTADSASLDHMPTCGPHTRTPSLRRPHRFSSVLARATLPSVSITNTQALGGTRQTAPLGGGNCPRFRVQPSSPSGVADLTSWQLAPARQSRPSSSW